MRNKSLHKAILKVKNQRGQATSPRSHREIALDWGVVTLKDAMRCLADVCVCVYVHACADVHECVCTYVCVRACFIVTILIMEHWE